MFLLRTVQLVRTVSIRPAATDDDLAALAAAFPDLEEIEGLGCRHITRKGLEQLAALERLKAVRFTGCDHIGVDDAKWFRSERSGCVTVFGRTIDDRVRFLESMSGTPTPRARKEA